MPKLEDFRGHELIKTSTIFWLFDHAPRNGSGWPLPVYFDRSSDKFRVVDTSNHGVYYECSELPPDGPFEFDAPEPIQFARDVFLTTIQVDIRTV